MALSPAQLKKLLDNPANFTADDMGLNDPEPEMLELPEGEDVEAPEMESEAELMADAEMEEPEQLDQESEEDAKLAKKKEDLNVQQNASQIISDTAAPMEMRKKALQQIKAKYLGR